MAVILISGQPGTGKTTLAKEICHRKDILLLSTDVIKSFYRICRVGKFSKCDSHDAWKVIGKKTGRNIIRGFVKHGQQFEDMAVALIYESNKAYKHIVLEGVHILPSILKKISGETHAYYIDAPSKKDHLLLFDKKNKARSQYNYAWYQNYQSIKKINTYAKRACRRSGFEIIRQADFPRIKKEILRKINYE